MADLIAVAEYILERKGKVAAMKLQKLIYYAQVWRLAWSDGEPDIAIFFSINFMKKTI